MIEKKEFMIDLEPEEFRRLGHELVDELTNFLHNIDELPVAPNANPRKIKDLIKDRKFTKNGLDAKNLTTLLVTLLSKNTCLNGHPRMWGYITGSPNPIGALADLIATTVNPNLAGWNGAPLATEIETQTVSWIAELLGYPKTASGIITSGGNMANFIGVLAARKAMADWDIRNTGLNHRSMIIYASQETHAWIEKAADLFGFGTQSIHYIDTNVDKTMCPDNLVAQIKEDRAKNLYPFIVVGSAGTTSIGAIDPLPAIAKICKVNKLWFHVDGCYGAPGILDQTAPQELLGMKLADSLAVDAHKWLYTALEAGCVLVKDQKYLIDAFATYPSYYSGKQIAHNNEVSDLYTMGPQNSRHFKALKVWLTLQFIGKDGYTTAISQNMAQARSLFNILKNTSDFEPFTCNLSIVTFRYVPEDLNSISTEINVHQYLNSLNAKLMTNIQRSGTLYLSNANIDDYKLLRVCIVNYRTNSQDINDAPQLIRKFGKALDAEMRMSFGN